MNNERPNVFNESIQLNKIVFFNPYADRHTKGAARRIELLSEAIHLQGREVKVVLKEEYLADLNPGLEKLALCCGLQRLAYFCAAARLARAPNTVVVSEVIFIPTWRKNIILTIHDLKAFDERASRGGRVRALAYRIFTQLARKIVVVSSGVKLDLVRHCNVPTSKVYVNYNGISGERINLAERNQRVAKLYDFVYVSSFARHKRHELLVTAAPAGAHLCFIGRDLGSLDNLLEQVARRGGEITVDIRTDVNGDDELFSLIGAAHCGVFPSVFEGFGIPLLEYAATGLFVMASDIPVFHEIADYVDLFFPPDDEAALGHAMAEFMQNKPTGNFASADLLRNSKFSEAAVTRAFLEIVDDSFLESDN